MIFTICITQSQSLWLCNKHFHEELDILFLMERLYIYIIYIIFPGEIKCQAPHVSAYFTVRVIVIEWYIWWIYIYFPIWFSPKDLHPTHCTLFLFIFCVKLLSRWTLGTAITSFVFPFQCKRKRDCRQTCYCGVQCSGKIGEWLGRDGRKVRPWRIRHNAHSAAYDVNWNTLPDI